MLPEVRIGIENQKFPIQEPIMYLMNALILIALGAWLIFFESRSNPHLYNYEKLDFKQRLIQIKASRLREKISRTENELSSAEAIMEMSKSSADDATAIAANELFSAVRESYRRALVNQVGNVDFTSNYLEQEYRK
jgi:hypothetical protein